MTAYLKYIPAGIPGDVSRSEFLDDDTVVLDPAKAPAAFGVPLKILPGGKFGKIEAGDNADSFKGVLARIVPAQGGTPDANGNSNGPNPATPQRRVKTGYMYVLCAVGVPVREGAVYMRVVAAAGKNIGDFEATADGTNNVLLPGVVWAVDGKDSANNTEIFLK